MIRWILRIVWLALSVPLAIWAYEGLTGVDQSESLLPFVDDRETDMIFPGVAWGLVGMFMSFTGGGSARSGSRAAARTQLAIGEVIEVRRTGLTVNDVPQYDVFLQVSPATGEPFVSSFRDLMDAGTVATLQPGFTMPVRYDPSNRDGVDVADPETPEVRKALLDWRVQKGLVHRDLIGARTRGLPHRASVVAVRPTGVQREGHVELELTLLIPADAGSAQREAETRVFLRPGALDHVQVGSPVFAMWEPGRPDKVAMTILREEPLG